MSFIQRFGVPLARSLPQYVLPSAITYSQIALVALRQFSFKNVEKQSSEFITSKDPGLRIKFHCQAPYSTTIDKVETSFNSDNLSPEIDPNDDLKVCFSKGRTFCYQAASLLDETLGKRAREIVTDMGFLLNRSKKIDDLDVIVVTFDRHDFESFDQTEFLWVNRLQELIEEGVLEKRAGTIYPVLSAKKETDLNNLQSIKSINMSIKNVTTMLLIRNNVLFREI